MKSLRTMLDADMDMYIIKAFPQYLLFLSKVSGRRNNETCKIQYNILHN